MNRYKITLKGGSIIENEADRMQVKDGCLIFLIEDSADSPYKYRTIWTVHSNGWIYAYEIDALKKENENGPS